MLFYRETDSNNSFLRFQSLSTEIQTFIFLLANCRNNIKQTQSANIKLKQIVKDITTTMSANTRRKYCANNSIIFAQQVIAFMLLYTIN